MSIVLWFLYGNPSLREIKKEYLSKNVDMQNTTNIEKTVYELYIYNTV